MKKDRIFSAKPDFTPSSVIGLASPQDRLAAFILDAAILIPIIQLLQAPFKKEILEALLYNTSSGTSTFRILNVIVIFVVLICYQTLMTYWKGQSLGKMFFHLKVISYQGHLTFYQSFLRSISFIVEFLSFGWMWVALFSHPMRRVFHDRISDTLVISTKSPTGLPSRKEIFSARLINGIFSIGFLLFFTGLVMNTDQESDALDSIVFGSNQCDKIKNQYRNDIESLTIAHLERKISSKCLYDFARENIWDEKDKNISHFAMALALKGSDDESNKYLEEICRLDESSSYCLLGKWLGKRGRGEKISALSLYEEIKGQKSSKIIHLILALYLQKDREYQRSLEVLSSIEKAKVTEDLQATLTFHSLLSMERFAEAFWVFKTHKNMGSHDLKHFYTKLGKTNKQKVKKHINFLKRIYPYLGKKNDGRDLASTAKENEAVRGLYEGLRNQL